MLLVHPANRRGALRGSSRREDVIDLVLGVRPPADWAPAQGVRFEVHVDKARNLPGAAPLPFLAELPADGGAWRIEPVYRSRLDRAVALLGEGLSVETMGKTLGVSRATAFRLQQRARRLGRLTARQSKE
jgi:putative DNA primase/helicase